MICQSLRIDVIEYGVVITLGIGGQFTWINSERPYEVEALIINSKKK